MRYFAMLLLISGLVCYSINMLQPGHYINHGGLLDSPITYVPPENTYYQLGVLLILVGWMSLLVARTYTNLHLFRWIWIFTCLPFGLVGLILHIIDPDEPLLGPLVILTTVLLTTMLKDEPTPARC